MAQVSTDRKDAVAERLYVPRFHRMVVAEALAEAVKVDGGFCGPEEMYAAGDYRLTCGGSITFMRKGEFERCYQLASEAIVEMKKRQDAAFTVNRSEAT